LLAQSSQIEVIDRLFRGCHNFFVRDLSQHKEGR
jgi:hypothetical protein